MSNGLQRDLVILARVLVHSPVAYRAVMQERDAGIDYVLQDMATNQAKKLVNLTPVSWEFAKTDYVAAPVETIQKAINVSLAEGNLPVSLIYYWKDNYWGVCQLPGPFEIDWKIRPHKRTGEALYAIPLKDFSIIVKYEGKSNTIIKQK